MSNNREGVRTPLKVRLCIEHPRLGKLMVSTRDISDTGVYALVDDAQSLLQAGELVTGQVQDLPIEAPVLQMEVVRVEPSGVGLRFMNQEDEDE